MASNGDEKNALTKAELKKTDAKWRAAVQDLKNRREGIQHGVLSLYWDAGAIAKSLLEGDGVYGNRVAEDLAKEMKWSVSTMRNAYRFNTRYTKAELLRAQKCGIPWRAITMLTALEDKTTREGLEKKLADGKIKSDDLKAEIAKINQKARDDGSRKDKRGNPSPVTAVNSGITGTHAAYVNVRGWVDQLIKLQKTKDDRFPKLAKESLKHIRATLAAFQKAEERIVKAQE
jgi:hypothetical protein